MSTVADFLRQSQVQYLATIGTDGRPKVRPFQFMLEEDGQLWFCTSNQKEVYREIQAHPHVEFCASGENLSWMRLCGKVVFSQDLSVKGKVLGASPLVKSIYQSPENPDFEVFHLGEATATIADFSGDPPRTYQL